MTLVVLLILAALWAVVLLPPLLRARTERVDDSIGSFHYHLGVLGRTNGAARPPAFGRRAPGGPAPRSSGANRWAAAKRRRDIVRVLAAAAAITLLGAVGTGHVAAWALHLLADALLGAYVAAWAWVRSLQAERAAKVRYLPQAAPVPGPSAETERELVPPELALRRTASS